MVVNLSPSPGKFQYGYTGMRAFVYRPMCMNIIEFKTKHKSEDGRPYLIAIPVDKIKTIESILGGEHVYCKVNGIEVNCSYRDLIDRLHTEF